MKFRSGEPVLLIEETEEGTRKAVLRAGEKTDRFRGVGVFDPAKLVGASPGDRVTIGTRTFTLARPTTADLLETIERKAQIVTAKDAATIVLRCGVVPGATVVEAGAGSGSLTLALASAVGEKGRVVTYDLREEFIEVAKRNVERAGLGDRVEFRTGDIRQGIAERDADAVVLDIPDPWEAVSPAKTALRIGGVLATYSPLVSQLEQAVRAMREQGFIDVRVTETLEREWVIGERGSRPSFDMLGHTGFLATARRV